MRDGDHHPLLGDQVLDRQFAFGVDDLGHPLIAELPGHRVQLVADDRGHLVGVGQDRDKLLDEGGQFLVFLLELFDFQSGQPAQRHVQDRLRLLVGEPEA
ncbi:MAG: hypothetical protein BWZ08_02624 [candidate division BRC1 bacterium ADurb.BinA292]|nr:MAG: hypothetical protein BWZ08_02624 [candidate division BRC1 bacterium ADurb.BinA292]